MLRFVALTLQGLCRRLQLLSAWESKGVTRLNALEIAESSVLMQGSDEIFL